MNRLRLHIIRLVIILFVGVGFSLSILQPVQAADDSTAFANWLRSKAKSVDGVDLQQELNKLQNSGLHFDKLIKEASHIVRNNDKAFDFSFSQSVASNQVYQLLLIEWNHVQTSNTISGVSTPPFNKSWCSGKVDEPLLHVNTFAVGSAELYYHDIVRVLINCSSYTKTLTPMVNSIAIGAP